MSVLTSHEMLCPMCEHPNETEVWASINVREDSELKDILLGGELNMVECEACHKIFYAEHFLLYHDPERELLAFVYPKDHETDRGEWEEKTKTDFTTLQRAESGGAIPYPPLTMFGLDELVAAVADDEEKQIQGEIVVHLSHEHGFRVKTLNPSKARQLKVPPILPIQANGSASYEALLHGLERLVKINDRLTVYQDFHAQLKKAAGLPEGLAPFLS